MADDQQKKPAEGAGAAKPAPPKPPAKEKPGPKPYEDELTRRLRARFGGAAGEATIDRDQVIVPLSPEKLLEACEYLRDEEKFDYLSDLTAIDQYGQDGRDQRFDVILNLYSMEHNQRLRLKVAVGDGQACPSVSGLWGTADWLERECYDMFGIPFKGHPDLKRILMPDGWQGYPLRKDYDILKQDDDWVRENMGIESGQ